jgi:DNA invertase Pin-like site-specific DNA recombinase
VRRQAQAIRQYAKEKGLAVRSIYMDPGMSGSGLARPELQRLIADCRAGQIGTVITQDPERLSRDTGQLLALLHIFQKTGVRVEFGAPEGSARLASLKVYLAALLELEEAKAVTDA